MKTTEPEVWQNATPEEGRQAEEVVRRLAGVCKTAGYWTPIGKVVEGLIYAHELGAQERSIIAFVLGEEDVA